MNRLTILILLTLTIYSCTTGTKKGEKINKLVITADSCKKWGLPPVNFEIEYSDDFKREINPTGGFYLQLRKVNGDTILQEISFGRIDGRMNEESLKRNLVYIDSILNVTFKNAGQIYKTDFLGTDNFFGKQSNQIRATINLKNLPRDNFIANGDYLSLMTCAYSPTSPDQAVMISVVSSKKEAINPNSKLGTTTTEILETFKIK